MWLASETKLTVKISTSEFKPSSPSDIIVSQDVGHVKEDFEPSSPSAGIVILL